jgi:hypothetical protein
MRVATKGILVSALILGVYGAAYAQGAGSGGGAGMGGAGGTMGGNGAGEGGTGVATPNGNGTTGSTSGTSGSSTTETRSGDAHGCRTSFSKIPRYVYELEHDEYRSVSGFVPSPATRKPSAPTAHSHRRTSLIVSNCTFTHNG